MVKKLSLATVVALSLGTGAFADGFYAKLSGGATSTDVDMANGNNVEFDTGYLVNVAVGKSFNAFDVELEYSYGNRDWENKTLNTKGSGKEKGFYLNGYYNFNTDTKFTPYIGAGIGRLKADDSFDSATETSYQGMIGGTFAVTEKVDLNIEYRYRKADYDVGDIDSNNYIFGVKYKF